MSKFDSWPFPDYPFFVWGDVRKALGTMDEGNTVWIAALDTSDNSLEFLDMGQVFDDCAFFATADAAKTTTESES